MSSPTIQLSDGHFFDFTQPERFIEKIDIATIAHALSNICRFTGHTRRHYSVAQHSVLVSTIVPPEHALAGLLHDAAEAFMGDVAAPLKALLPDYKAIEKRVEAVVLSRFGLAVVLPPEVKYADRVMLATEQRDLMPGGHKWESIKGIQPWDHRIFPIDAPAAMELFIARFNQLDAKRR